MEMFAHGRDQINDAIPVTGYSEDPMKHGMRIIEFVVESLSGLAVSIRRIMQQAYSLVKLSSDRLARQKSTLAD
jgi:hypothetical protein